MEAPSYLYSEVIVPTLLEQLHGPYSKIDCYYSGYVEDVPSSDVVISICNGQNCFLNLPKDATERKACGNGLVEDGEQCDCGTEELLKVGTVCREAVSDCDLDEYCSGTTESCPPDVFKQNGMPCGIDSTCYLGACLDIHRHCQKFFGKGKEGKAKRICSWWGGGSAKPAPLSCYKEVNFQGDRTGNCGQDKSGYKKCPEK
ncbi:hypothetical protein E2320_005675 [Naja naja]|nr:hypothetical protein E2320_005675 [Naja naja]